MQYSNILSADIIATGLCSLRTHVDFKLHRVYGISIANDAVEGWRTPSV